MSTTDVPEDVRESAQYIWDTANADLESALNALVADMKTRQIADEPMCFSTSLIQVQEHHGIAMPPRLHGMYVAAVYRLARERLESQR